MTERELQDRTKRFSLRVLTVVDSLPGSRASRILADQLGRCGTSVAANYRAACRSRSPAEMISKLAIVEEEADESSFWLELASDHGILSRERVASLLDEANQLTAIMVASRRTLARNRKSGTENRK